MNEYIVKEIEKNKTRCLFISPHLDDAILSCGGLISSLRNKTDIEVLTIFTRATPKPESEFARWYVNSCGYNDSQRFFADRLKEDKNLFKKLKIKSLYFDLIDAGWRKKPLNYLLAKIFPKLIHLYPSMQDVFRGKYYPEDNGTFLEVQQKLVSLIDASKVILFIPLGVGAHVDHILVREAGRKKFKRVIYWSDFPYSLKADIDEEFVRSGKLTSFNWSKGLSEKRELIKEYKTQLESMFPSGIIPMREEVYFFNEKDLRMR